ncbi:hypothetical protein N7519_004763 [Penicillium mononematosum]|uniref:uncharacterized protein n=1 Tax=Penicillium mononematosum TaxID=268346 RepID=UPI0025471E4D|nr:uncharacterized protein N7519_004763 [Penicillium mononematosum]KAJ6189855.1 hypothetical protein N7519_004763 [Penicillium mononematosum]
MNIPRHFCDILKFLLAKSDVTFALIGIDRLEKQILERDDQRRASDANRLTPIYQNVTSGHIWPINVVEWEVFNETIRDVSAGEGILEAVMARALLGVAFQVRVHLNEV